MESIVNDMAGRAEQEILTVAGREVAISNPGKVLFPQAGYTKLDLVRYYLAVADGALRGAGGRPERARPLPERHRRRVLLPEARARVAAAVDRGRRAAVSVGPHAPKRSCRATPRRSCGWRTSPASSCIRIRCAPTISIIPTSCASTSIRCPASSGRRSARSRGVVRATLDDFGLVGWPKTSGSRGMHVYVRIERRWTFDEVRRAALALAREVERRAPGARDEQVVEGRAPRRVPRLQPEREGPHGRERVLGAARRRTRASRRRSTWDEIDACDPADFTLRDDAGALRARSAIGTPAIDSRPCSLDALLELSARQEREGLGDAPWPPHYRKQPGEAAARRRRRERRDADVHPLHRDRPRAQKKADALAGLERWKARHPDASRAPRSRPTCSSTRCAAASRTWTRIRVNLQHVPAELRPAQEPLDPDEDMADDWSGVSRAAAGRAEDLLELVRRRDLELIVAAVARRLVRPPAQEDRRVAERGRPACGRTSPRRRARCAAAPTTDPCRRSSGSVRPACASSSPSRLGPLAPRVIVERVARAAARAPSPSCLRVAIVNDEVTPT